MDRDFEIGVYELISSKDPAHLSPLDDHAAGTVKNIRKPEEPVVVGEGPAVGGDDFAVAAPAVTNFGRGRGR